MAVALFRIFALVALVLMPFGMAAEPALAKPADHVMAMTGHCDDTGQKQDAPARKAMDCTASCTALPAADVAIPEPMFTPTLPRITAFASPFSGIEPELATPPPKLG